MLEKGCSLPPLLPARRRQLQGYLVAELNKQHMQLSLIICFFVSGLIDGVALSSWNCFVNMQTGNTILAALGISNEPEGTSNQQWVKSLMAIGSSCLGSLFFNFLHRYPSLSEGPTSRKRGVLVLSMLIQVLMIVVAAILVATGFVSDLPAKAGKFSSGTSTPKEIGDDNYLDLTAIGILAFQSAGQISLSRILGLAEFPTIVLTATYHVLTAEVYVLPKVFRQSKTWKEFLVKIQVDFMRLGAVVALFTGAIIGGEMLRRPATGGVAGVLWLAAGLKVLICFAWIFWPPEPQKEMRRRSTHVSKEEVPRGALEAVKDTWESIKGKFGEEKVGYLRLTPTMIENHDDQFVVEEMEVIGREAWTPGDSEAANEGTVKCLLKKRMYREESV